MLAARTWEKREGRREGREKEEVSSTSFLPLFGRARSTQEEAATHGGHVGDSEYEADGIEDVTLA